MVDLPRTADIVIIGGGVHGASLAYHLARKKAGRVVLIEKKFVASGPTGRSTALVRRFYAMDFFTRTASASRPTCWKPGSPSPPMTSFQWRKTSAAALAVRVKKSIA